MSSMPRIFVQLDSSRFSARYCPLPVPHARSVAKPMRAPVPLPSSSSMTPSVSGRPKEPAYYPGIEEELEVSYDAYHRAFEESKPEVLQVEGLQEFAAAIWQRRSNIPSSNFKDPLLNIFDEFDTDSTGELTAEQIAKALNSYSVAVSTEQVQWYITRFEEHQQKKFTSISRQEFPMFIFSMAIGDLHAHPEAVRESSDESCDLP